MSMEYCAQGAAVRRWIGAFALVCCGMGGSPSYAGGRVTQYSTHATSCQPGYGMSGSVAYGEPGIGNFSWTTDARIFCPVDIIEPESQHEYADARRIDVASLEYADNSSEHLFWCYPWAVDFSGGQFWGAARYSCSQVGGCPDPTTAFVGRNRFFWSSPFGDAWISYATFGYSCSIPPRQRDGYASWVEQGWTSITTDYLNW